MNDEIFVVVFMVIFIGSIILGLLHGTVNTIGLNEVKWTCTQSSIHEGAPRCEQYTLKEVLK